ncbi:hypothetical protein BOFE_08630 (plasmid) [Candidatus Borrelia fainii]|uniref:Uncharacterized protein n=1 Tax=Candidatus Borrelia fainii TaxID=2518322 RepID=A0ABN6USF6_9SPIR|nr:hypothetical protein BOFE_08630 [Candidatus Borrelia fainii]
MNMSFFVEVFNCLVGLGFELQAKSTKSGKINVIVKISKMYFTIFSLFLWLKLIDNQNNLIKIICIFGNINLISTVKKY